MAEHVSGESRPGDRPSTSSEPDTTDKAERLSSLDSQSSPTGNANIHVRNKDSVTSDLSANSEKSLLSTGADEIDVSHVPLSAEIHTPLGPMDAPTRYDRRSLFLPKTLPIGPASESTPNISLRRASSYDSATTKPESHSRKSSIKHKRFSRRRKLRNHSRDDSIPEEDIDLNLLSTAMPMAFNTKGLDRIANEDGDHEDTPMVSPMAMPFDLSSFPGPMTNAQREEYNRQEASGILTGGLGAGWTPDSTITSKDLMTETPTSAASRRISFRNPGLKRAPTLRDLGQIEANKRGKIVQVLIEDSPVDISSFSGGAGVTKHDLEFGSVESLHTMQKKGSFKSSTMEIFYPQANWKPFSMRWPYLTGLIIISVVLGAAQEYLYQKSQKEPLYSFTTAAEMRTWDYFCFKYLPTGVAVAFGVLWQVTDFEVKRLEAYYQLSKDGGALAAESINVDYITS
jgi:hypothetical protein